MSIRRGLNAFLFISKPVNFTSKVQHETSSLVVGPVLALPPTREHRRLLTFDVLKPSTRHNKSLPTRYVEMRAIHSGVRRT